MVSSHTTLRVSHKPHNQAIRLRERILPRTVLANSKQSLSVPNWRNNSICRDRALAHRRLPLMDAMERLKDVRRQTVRQWLLAPHKQASWADLGFCSLMHSLFCIRDSPSASPFCEIDSKSKRIGLGRIWLPRIVRNSSLKAPVRVLLV